MHDPTITCLHICTTCRADGRASGQVLLESMLALLAEDQQPVRVQAVECLANCDRGCSAAISAAGKWSYLLGHLSPALAGDLLAYARLYACSQTGTVLPSRRPASLSNVVIGRIPSMEHVA